LWLDLRPNVQEQECVFGKEAWNYCRETCGNCITFPTVAPSPMPSKSLPTVSPAPSAKNPYDQCDDDRHAFFFVNETGIFEPCKWLWSRPEMQLVYCNSSHPSSAWNLCSEVSWGSLCIVSLSISVIVSHIVNICRQRPVASVPMTVWMTMQHHLMLMGFSVIAHT
jgi:hypothetical protein